MAGWRRPGEKVGVADSDLPDRQVRDLIRGWVMDRWLVVTDPAKRSRAYTLSVEYWRSVGEITAVGRIAPEDDSVPG